MFATLKQKYEKGFLRKDQLLRYVSLGKISEGEYREIVGEAE